MFNQLPQFIESNSESLNAIIPAHLLAKLKIANDYHQIIKILLTPVHLSLTSLRLIDVLLKNDALHFLQLLKLLTKMPTQFWYQLLTTPSNQGVTPLEYWHLDKNGINEPLLTIITHIPANYDKLKLLTTSFKTDFYFSLGTYCTLLTSTLLSLTQRLRLLEGFNEADKFAGALTTEMPTQRSNLFMQLDNANHANNFIQSFTNLKWQQQLTHYLELAHLRQQATHFLGIADHPLTLDLEPHMLAHFEGMQPQNAINRFNEVLDKFEPMPAAMLPFKQEFSAIKQAFKAMDLTQDAEYFMQQYQQHNLVILDSGWADHSIALAATPDFLVVANRGQHQHFAGGCVIYPLVHPLNLAQIEQLTGYLTQYTFQKNLRQIINHDNNGVAQLFYALELSPQKYGTCTIANKKALVAGLLPLLKQLSTPNQKKEEILALSRTAYKAFTLHTRHIVLAKLINQVKLQQEIEQPITDFLNQHTNLAKPSELALLKQTSNNLPATVLTRLDKNLNPQAKFIMAYLQQFPNLTKVSDTVLQVISYSSILSNFEKQEIFLNHCLTLMHDDTKIINTSTWYRNQDILDFLLLTQQYFWLLNSLQNVSKDILKKSEVHLNIFIKITQAAQQSDQHNIPLIKLCINYIIDQLDQNQINALLTFNQLDHITEGYWLAYILENLTATQVIHFFNQIPKNQSPLSELRDLAYLKYVANNVSPQRFIEFMTISATNGNIYPLLFDYSNDIACFNFLKAQLNSKTLKQHINYYKKINITENPSKVTAQLNLLDAAKELTVFWAAQPQSKFIDTITKLSNTPQSTELAETLWGDKKYYSFLIKQQCYSLMLKQLQIINYPQLLTLAKQSDLLVNLIFAANTNDLIQPLATQCLGYLLDNLNPESIQQALSVLILQQIYQGSVIKLILKNLTDTQILQLFSQTNLFNQSGLMADHDLNFLQYLANRLGSSNFKQLLHVTDHRGQAHSVLFYYAKNLPSFNFLLSNFSTTELLLHIENYQHPVTNQPNLLLALLDDSVKSFIAPKHLPDLYKSIELLASEFSSEQIYQWLFAVTKPNNSNACGLNYVFSHQQLAVFFTELFSTQHLLRRLIGNDELNFSKIISTANCHGLWDIIYHRFNDRQIKQLLTTNMQSNARSALDSGNYNILAKIIQYTQNPSAIELVTKNQLLIEANLLPKIMQNFLLEATMLYPKNKIFTIFKANSTLTPTLNNQATYVTNHDSPSNSSFRYT